MDLSERRKILVLRNPQAGGRGGGYLMRVVDRLERAGCSVTVRETAGPGDARVIAAGLEGGAFDVLAVAGGDGTINEAANGIGADGPPLAVIPMGTANVFAREIGLRWSPDAVADTIAHAAPQPIHTGRVNGRRFLSMAGVGLDAQVVGAIDAVWKRRLGATAYALWTAAELWRYRFPPLDVRVDGEVITARSVVAANGRFYGGRLICAPDADITRDRLDVVIHTGEGRASALGCVAALVVGRLDRRADIRILPARRIVIEGPEGAPVQVDGDVVARLPVTITMAEDQISVLIPDRATARDGRRGGGIDLSQASV